MSLNNTIPKQKVYHKVAALLNHLDENAYAVALNQVWAYEVMSMITVRH